MFGDVKSVIMSTSNYDKYEKCRILTLNTIDRDTDKYRSIPFIACCHNADSVLNKLNEDIQARFPEEYEAGRMNWTIETLPVLKPDADIATLNNVVKDYFVD